MVVLSEGFNSVCPNVKTGLSGSSGSRSVWNPIFRALA